MEKAVGTWSWLLATI